MTDKEKEAIETYKNFLDDISKNGGCIIDIDFQHKKEYEIMWEILRIIENQQAKIKEIKKQKHNQSSLRRLNERKMRKYRTENKGLKAEIEKKDKMIDLMAEQLTTPIHSKEWVIEYYTKEVEDK